MKAWSVRGRLVFSLSVVIAVMAGASIYALAQLSAIEHRASELDADHFPAQVAIGKLKAVLLGESALALQRLYSTDPAEESRIDGEIASDNQKMHSLLDEYRSTVKTVQDSTLYNGISRSATDYFAALDQVVRLDSDGKTEQGYSFFKSVMRPDLDRFLAATDAAQTAKTRDAGESGMNLKVAARTSAMVTFGGATIAMIISLLIGAFLVRAVEAAQAATRKSEARFRSLADSNVIGVIFTDPEGRINGANDAFLRMLRYSREELEAGKLRWDMMTPPEFRNRSETALKEVMQLGKAVPFEKEYIAGDGKRVPVLIGVAKLEGSEAETFALVIDLTERKTVEAQLRRSQKMESIGTLAGGIAHDFNNILTAIIGYTGLLETEIQPDGPCHEYIAEVLKASGRAKDLVNQILTFSRRTEQDYKAIQLKPIVKEVLKLLRASFPRSIEIRPRLGSDLPNVFSDSTEIHQVIMNLATNAMHAMKERGGVLTVNLDCIYVDADFAALHHDLREGPYVRLTVSDTGCGMDKDTLERVFDPFFTTKEPGEGTGLGMSVVHGIVKSCRGSIWLYSEIGVGTTVNLYLPACEDQDTERAPGLSVVPHGNGERVLLVEDEEALVKMNTTILERLGYNVSPCANSQEALDRVRSGPDQFDVILTDFGMPGMNGIDLARESLKARPDLRVILATGYGGSMNTKTALDAGVCEFIMKPTTSRSLGEAIWRALGKEQGQVNG